MAHTVDMDYMVARFPSLGLQDPTDTEQVNNYIEWAACLTDETVFATCQKLNMAVSNLTAHFLVMYGYASNDNEGESGANAGPITSEKVGDLQRAYGTAVGATNAGALNLNETSYGRFYLMLVSSVVTSPIFNC